MGKLLIKNATIINEGSRLYEDILIDGDIITSISKKIQIDSDTQVIEAHGLILIPGMIDDQVHFREPGLTHKANIFTESRAAVAGGITSFMEMPNTIPNTVTQDLLERKYATASKNSLANFSFYMGANNNNLKEVLKTNTKNVCGIKVFMGSSTGNMLVDNKEILAQIFKNSPLLIATHCEDELTIKNNLSKYIKIFGDDIPFEYHPKIRSEEACYLSSSFAVELAKKYETRLHILHISTARELELFAEKKEIMDKKITAECCIHHLWFNDNDYKEKESLIKWNPAVKSEHDRSKLIDAINDDIVDVIATDHAPHTIKEKSNNYINSPSGGPLVQHALITLLELEKGNEITLAKIVKKTSHDVADCFQIEKRGYLRPGYFADIVLINRARNQIVKKENLLYKCGWSPFEGYNFGSSIDSTFINGERIFHNGSFSIFGNGMRLTFKS